MEIASGIELRPQANQSPPAAEVFIDGAGCGTVVTGNVLEAAVRCDQRLLLFATDGIASEDMLSIHLLGPDRKLLDSATVGGPYATGVFSDLRLQPPATVLFRFFDDAQWCVRILETARRALPWWPDARGVWRGSRLTRYFEVSRL